MQVNPVQDKLAHPQIFSRDLCGNSAPEEEGSTSMTKIVPTSRHPRQTLTTPPGCAVILLGDLGISRARKDTLTRSSRKIGRIETLLKLGKQIFRDRHLAAPSRFRVLQSQPNRTPFKPELYQLSAERACESSEVKQVLLTCERERLV
jgi:hypothetical protein